MGMKDIIARELSFKITGISFKVHNEQGRFCREKQYADRFEELLIENKIPYNREYELRNFFVNAINGNKVDF